MSLFYRFPHVQREPKTAEHQRFASEYFSGSDVSIYLGDIWVDEITNLTFALQEQVRPVFGYASYVADTWARGNRLITGSFRINFKESYYLHGILDVLEERNAGKTTDAPTIFKTTERAQNTIEQVLAMTKTASSRQQFERLANAYQAAIWGDASLNQQIRQRITNQPLDTYFTPNSVNPTLREQGFNILINYGATLEENHRRQRSLALNGPVKSIVGVQLTGVTQIIDGSGAPIEEEYLFVARDLDQSI